MFNAAVHNFLPDADLADSQVQQALRELIVPRAVLDELRRVGRLAVRNVGRISAPGLVLQGTLDEVAQPELTRRLARRFGPRLLYREVEAGHTWIRSEDQGFAPLREQVLAYLAALQSEPVEG